MTSGTSVEAPRATDLVDLACTRCALHQRRTQVVPAEGRPSARMFLVGEAPGPDEDRQGRPFVGRAGKILRRCLDDAGVPRDDVWISNAAKCFPNVLVDGNRRIVRPKRAEVEACLGWLRAEVDVVKPRLLIAVGVTAAEALTGRRGLRMTKMHGRRLPARDELGDVDVFLTFHPSGLHYGHASAADMVRDLRTAFDAVKNNVRRQPRKS